jgi:hypothetical protein
MNPEQTEAQTATANPASPAVTRRRRAPHTAPVAPPKATTRKKASGAKKATKPASPKSAKTVRPEAVGRGGTKTDKILALLKRPGGTTLKELMKATGWQPHSVRGFLSGVIGRKLKLKIASVKDDSNVRRYSVKS